MADSSVIQCAQNSLNLWQSIGISAISGILTALFIPYVSLPKPSVGFDSLGDDCLHTTRDNAQRSIKYIRCWIKNNSLLKKQLEQMTVYLVGIDECYPSGNKKLNFNDSIPQILSIYRVTSVNLPVGVRQYVDLFENINGSWEIQIAIKPHYLTATGALSLNSKKIFHFVATAASSKSINFSLKIDPASLVKNGQFPSVELICK